MTADLSNSKMCLSRPSHLWCACQRFCFGFGANLCSLFAPIKRKGVVNNNKHQQTSTPSVIDQTNIINRQWQKAQNNHQHQCFYIQWHTTFNLFFRPVEVLSALSGREILCHYFMVDLWLHQPPAMLLWMMLSWVDPKLKPTWTDGLVFHHGRMQLQIAMLL